MGMDANIGSSARQCRCSQLAWRRNTNMWVGTVNKKVSISKTGARDVLR